MRWWIHFNLFLVALSMWYLQRAALRMLRERNRKLISELRENGRRRRRLSRLVGRK